MKIKESSWLIQYAYIMDKYSIPVRTSLCALFWRTIGVTALFGFFSTMVIALLIIMAKNPAPFFVALAIVVGIIVAVFGVIGSFKVTTEYLQGKRGEDSTVWQALRAVKGKFCPIIDITDKD